jgi:hypothetical protein
MASDFLEMWRVARQGTWAEVRIAQTLWKTTKGPRTRAKRGGEEAPLARRVGRRRSGLPQVKKSGRADELSSPR